MKFITILLPCLFSLAHAMQGPLSDLSFKIVGDSSFNTTDAQTTQQFTNIPSDSSFFSNDSKSPENEDENNFYINPMMKRKDHDNGDVSYSFGFPSSDDMYSLEEQVGSDGGPVYVMKWNGN